MFAVKNPVATFQWLGTAMIGQGTTICSSSPVPWDFNDAKKYVDENEGCLVYHVRGFIKKQVYPRKEEGK